MSFSMLPPELLGGIFRHAPTSDHLRFCLVSRMWYSETVPLIYETIVILAAECGTRVWYETLRALARGEWAAGTLDTKKFEREEEANDKKHLNLMEAFRRHPSYMIYIKELHLSFYITDPADEEDRFTLDTVQVLRNSRNLRSLHIGSYWRHDDPCEKHTRWVLSHVPPTVTVLDLKDSSLSAKTILKLLHQLPNLKRLTLANDPTLGEWKVLSYCEIPKLIHLEQLYLDCPFRSKQFLRKLLAHSPSLSTIVTVPLSVQALNFEGLSSVTQVVIQGSFSATSIRPFYSTTAFVSDLVDILQRHTKLDNFGIVALHEEEEEAAGSESHISEVSKLLLQADFLQYLPHSLRSLVLIDTAIDPLHVAKYINGLGSDHNLEILKCSIAKEKWFGTDDDVREKMDDELELACVSKSVCLEWYSGGKRIVRPSKAREAREKQICAELEELFKSWKLVPKEKEEEGVDDGAELSD